MAAAYTELGTVKSLVADNSSVLTLDSDSITLATGDWLVVCMIHLNTDTPTAKTFTLSDQSFSGTIDTPIERTISETFSATYFLKASIFYAEVLSQPSSNAFLQFVADLLTFKDAEIEAAPGGERTKQIASLEARADAVRMVVAEAKAGNVKPEAALAAIEQAAA